MEMVPVVLFVFNRPDKTEQIIQALFQQTVRPRQALVFADGPRSAMDEPNVNTILKRIRDIDWMDVQLISRKYNFGCANNIIEGLNEVFRSYDRAAILEDDTLPVSIWYESILSLLEHYQDEPMIFSVGAYPSIKTNALPDYPFDVIFSPRFSCWGWGTWANRWKTIEETIANFKNPFSSAKNVPFYAGYDLKRGAELVEKNPGFYWDIPISLICLHRRLLNAITRHYLIKNIGVDSGTHGSKTPQQLIEFTETHNAIGSRIPTEFPPILLRDDICNAIQEYVTEITSLISEPRKHRLAWSSLSNSIKCTSATMRKAATERFWKGTRQIRTILARLSRTWFSRFYSTLDNPMEVPVQMAAYRLATERYIKEGDSVLDVGFGLGYGLEIMAGKADRLSGIEVDCRSIERMKEKSINPKITNLMLYDGYTIPFPERSFDVVTCIDVIEHVPDYMRLIGNLCKTAKRTVIISTPNKRMEYTDKDGRPKNFWHLREWTHEEFDEILKLVGEGYEWNFLNGPWGGPFSVSNFIKADTMALTPAIILRNSVQWAKK
jgi:2-polyprenyl-3-methyl-5-hydroxy-6-metoxy-1,4-benzoquinol methylase